MTDVVADLRVHIRTHARALRNRNPPADHPSYAYLASLRKLLAWLRRRKPGTSDSFLWRSKEPDPNAPHWRTRITHNDRAQFDVYYAAHGTPVLERLYPAPEYEAQTQQTKEAPCQSQSA